MDGPLRSSGKDMVGTTGTDCVEIIRNIFMSKLLRRFLLLVASMLFIKCASLFGQSPFPNQGNEDFARDAMKQRESAVLKALPPAVLSSTNSLSSSGFGGTYPWKLNIVTTLFWIGGPGSATSSAWDPGWKRHYGGLDNPKSSARHDYIPNSFTPHLNPFYCALPYNDVKGSTTKPEAYVVIPWFKATFERPGKSVCQNRWIAVRGHDGRVCYAQWSDCGPFLTDHWEYVFGRDVPKRNRNGGTGLVVSPAVRDYLGFDTKDVCDWKFVELRDVPPGPWSRYGDNNDFVINARKSTESAPVTMPSPGQPTGITR